jgi:hypothetical protein
MDEWFLPGTAPDRVEGYYHLDSTGRIVIDPPAEARAWALEAGVRLAQESTQPETIAFDVFPAAGSRFFMAPEVPTRHCSSVPAGRWGRVWPTAGFAALATTWSRAGPSNQGASASGRR